MNPDEWREANLSLGLQIIRIDIAETRAWQISHRGPYVAPEVGDRLIADNVALELACAAMSERNRP